LYNLALAFLNVTRLLVHDFSSFVRSQLKLQQKNSHFLIVRLVFALLSPNLQLIAGRPPESDELPLSCPSTEDDPKKRLDRLARRPSYRKILNELSSAESGPICTLDSIKSEPSDSPLSQASPSLAHLAHLHHQQPSPNPPSSLPHTPSSASSLAISSIGSAVSHSALAAAAALAAHHSSASGTIDHNNNDTSSESPLSATSGTPILSVKPYLKVLPAAMQLPTSGPDLLQHGFQLTGPGSVTSTASTPSGLGSLHSQQQSGIAQYAQAQDAQFFVSGASDAFLHIFRFFCCAWIACFSIVSIMFLRYFLPLFSLSNAF
jgi:hypothetical protein